ncbi:MAG: sigma-54 dependent transcriptional regulator [Bacteroidetes bacterium]|nr:sigma-54 dependent transcriptional regulator [Bacteroidota bacterium]
MKNLSTDNYLIIKNKKMQDVYNIAARITRVDFPVLIIGETGVGKEMVAKYIHNNSLRNKTGKFVSLICSAIQDTLIESELFGHVKGAFTGADFNKVGLIKIADNGTLFLDEIGEMSLGMQRKLLRVLESGEYFPVGSVKVEKSNFRLICATNKNLKQKIISEEFRADLYHRINAVTIKIPPLRERIDEIPSFVEHFIKVLGYDGWEVSVEVMEKFLCHNWPGNIRELKNIIESAIVMMEENENIISLRHLPADLFADAEYSYLLSEDTSLKNIEKVFRESVIKYAIDFYKGDYKKVMTSLHISKDILYRTISKNPELFNHSKL